ncbi:protease HtpX [Stagnimonas aquatica]|uniref:Protease HtpX n=1 Tax=Stagnimonas aquatica TaxID=2689987 RepID=A0A3N0VDT8_9GAMM|nr:protease HtpX [Stagnimonas aquatica]ROH90852.1 protease HtpX [Stagnimonas aquatica]
MKRIALFLLTNIAVVLVLGVVCSLLGVDRYLTANGLNLTSLLIFSAVMGMGGSFISLAMSKWMAKRSTGAEVITQPRNSAEMWLLQTVERQARAAGIGMPEVAIYDSPEPNAFATGMNKNNALVAVSTGLLRAMKQEEVEAVLGHEIGHVANGDMVTLTLIQGVVNTFVIFLSRVIAYAVDQFLRRGDSRDSGPGVAYMLVSLVMQVVLGIGASMIVAAFSRYREFRADAAGAQFAGRRKMIAALQRLQSFKDSPSQLPKEMTAFGIREGMMGLFSSHPPLEKRIAALEQAQG